MDSSNSATVLKPTPWTGDLVQAFHTFLFDCDGVLWKGMGPTLEKIPGAIEAVNQLKANGKRVLFISNNSAQSRSQYVTKLTQVGINATKEDIFSSAFAAAMFLVEKGFQSTKEKGKVCVLGEAGLAAEIKEAGIEVVELRTMFGPKHLNRAELEELKFEPDLKALVVGMDSEFTFTKLCFTTFLLGEGQDVLFVSTNQDQTFPSATRTFPGSGSIVNAVATAAMREPVNVGKPTSYLLDVIVKQFGLQDEKDRVIMIGDRLNTDIQFGIDGGLKTMAVFTGVTSMEEINDPATTIKPDYVLDSVGNIFK